jgi:toxin ParE1/3/4
MSGWEVRLVADALRDYSHIIEQSEAQFGPRQSDIYETTINLALYALHAGPEPRGSVDRRDLRPGLRSLHIARGGRRGRHLLIYRVINANTIEVIRILHDAMDFSAHLKAND